MKFEPRHLDDNVNVTSTNHFGEFVRLSAWLVTIIFGIYLVLGIAAESLAEHLPPAYEKAMGGLFTSQLNNKDFPKTQVYAQGVLDGLVAKAEGLPVFTYKVFVEDKDVVNALALPAGNIVLFKGLLQEIRTENELAMVLAHELGHYANRDHLHGLGRGLVFISIASALGISGGLPAFISPAVQTLDLRFSRTQESLADDYGIDLVNRVYGHVGGSIDMFQVLATLDQKRTPSPEFLSSHPDSIWRIRSMAERIQTKSYLQKDPLAVPGKGMLPFADDSIAKEPPAGLEQQPHTSPEVKGVDIVDGHVGAPGQVE